MKIAVVGSREFDDEDMINAHLLHYCGEKGFDCFISGGARGVDTIVENFCKANDKLIEVIRPINPSNKMDYLFRNVEIITKADIILAFWDGKSRGTKFVIDYAKARGKPIKVFYSKSIKSTNSLEDKK